MYIKIGNIILTGEQYKSINQVKNNWNYQPSVLVHYFKSNSVMTAIIHSDKWVTLQRMKLEAIASVFDTIAYF